MSDEFILGQIQGTVKAIDAKLTAQNGAINSMKESINGLSERVSNLPCEIHAERITNFVNNLEKASEKDLQDAKERRLGRRELLIAFVAAVITSATTLIGIWLFST